MKTKEFIEKNFKLCQKFQPVSLRLADDQVYLNFLAEELDEQFYKKYPEFLERRKQIGHLSFYLEDDGAELMTRFGFTGNADIIPKEILSEFSKSIEKRGWNPNWRDQIEDLGGQAYSGWMMLDGKFSEQWLSNLCDLRHGKYIELATYRYMIFISEIISRIGSEHLTSSPEEDNFPSPQRCKHYFKQHELLKGFNITRWSKELSSRKRGGQGIQPPPDLKKFILENFLKLKDDFYGLKQEDRNTFFLFGRDQDEYNRMSFRTIYFDYMTLWNAVEKEKINLSVDADLEKLNVIQSAEIKFTTGKKIEKETLAKLIDYAKKDHSISEFGVGMNFLLYLINLIDENVEWSKNPEKRLEKKLALVKFAWKNWFRTSHPVFNVKQEAFEGNQLQIENFSEKNLYSYFLAIVTERDPSISTKESLDRWGIYNLHNALEVKYWEWLKSKNKESFDEYLIDEADTLASDFLINKKKCNIYELKALKS
tara:strand:+ start:156 stop:1598 length:1443 start_codon:yes stop_codon:yes gene_type:complete